MNKKIIIIALIVIILIIGGYFIFINRSSAPTPVSNLTSTPIASPVPATGQPAQTGSVAYTDPNSFAPGFLQCSSSELKMPFSGNNIYVATVFGIENGNCHYAVKIVDQNGLAVQGGPPGSDCKVPMALINGDVFAHLFGADKTPAVKAAQIKLQADYCK
jgi:hypothetical protein